MYTVFIIEYKLQTNKFLIAYYENYFTLNTHVLFIVYNF